MAYNKETETGAVSPTATGFGMVRWARTLAIGTGVALGTFGLAAGTANATPYAFGNLLFSNVTLSGLSGGTIAGSGVQASDGADYPGAPPASLSANGSLTGGADVLQATAGAGPFPGQNSFTPAGLAAGGTRGDAILFGNLLTGSPAPGANLVAEGRLLTGTSAASNAGTTTGFSLTLAVDTTADIRLTFGASSSLLASTTAAGDSASAQTNASFRVQGPGVDFTYAPSAVNQNVFSASGGPSGTFDVGSFAGDSGLVILGAGVYNISLLAGVQERLSIGAVPPPIPEPASLALVGTAILGFGVLRSRRKKA